MERIQLKSHVGVDGMLRVETPVDFSDQDVEVVLIVRSDALNDDATLGELGFVAETAGKWQGDPLVRESQEFEVREKLT